MHAKHEDCPECGTPLTSVGYDTQQCACGWGPWQRPSLGRGLRVLVCGGREYADRDFVFETLDGLHADNPFAIVIQGGATGADKLAEAWAAERLVHCATVRPYWKSGGKLDRTAGHKRNAAMIALCPHLVIAFPGGRGTADTCALALRGGLALLQPKRAPLMIPRTGQVLR